MAEANDTTTAADQAAEVEETVLDEHEEFAEEVDPHQKAVRIGLIVIVVLGLLAAISIIVGVSQGNRPRTKEEVRENVVTPTIGRATTDSATDFDQTGDGAWSYQEVWAYYKQLKGEDPKKAAAWLETHMTARNVSNEKDLEKKYLAMIAKEAAGMNFRVQLKKDVPVTNTGYKNGNAVYLQRILKKGDWVLVDEKGEIWVRVKCVNAIAPPGAAPSKQRRPRTTRRDVKGPDLTGGAARQPLLDQNAVTSVTPGRENIPRGYADTVTSDQQATSGTDAHTSSGSAGSGAGSNPTPGGTNSSGESNSGGGAADTTTHDGEVNTGTLPTVN